MKPKQVLLTVVAIAAVLLIASLSGVLTKNGSAAPAAPVTYKIETVASGFDFPWALAFLPDGDLLVTGREGYLVRVDAATGEKTYISDLPPVVEHRQGGLLDVILHPQFESNNRIYLSHAAPDDGGVTFAVTMAVLEEERLTELREVFRLPQASRSGQHFGSRFVFDDDGYLYFSIGDRGDRPRAQDKSDPAGSILRLTDTGGIPEDNPFLMEDGAHPAIYATGSRNAQGMAIHPETRIIWFHEHGPRGGDEVNILEKGANYGWPEISHGREYHLPKAVGSATSADWAKDPIHVWTPSIAPSGMTFYTGDKFPAWQGSLFSGALAGQHLSRLTLEGETVLAEERLLTELEQRIRDVRQGPDGYLYILLDTYEGDILRLVPAGKNDEKED
ncbi:MAG: PQQ-dependent sugar dehydrogenase [Micavibrio sp.]|nr:MAG: PQQ-dependent sugar dehydrogenase [Micavibrio sp.]